MKLTVVEYLLSQKASVDSQNKAGRTPLHLAFEALTRAKSKEEKKVCFDMINILTEYTPRDQLKQSTIDMDALQPTRLPGMAPAMRNR